MSLMAYSNGEFLPADSLTISVFDTGFMLGVTISEQLRTFKGVPFRAQAHFDRLATGLDAIGLGDFERSTDFARILSAVLRKNRGRIDPEDDLGINIFVTPGRSALMGDGARPVPNVSVVPYLLAFQRWSEAYTAGQAVTCVDVQQVPTAAWSPGIKCRSRMHYYRAEHEARRLGQQLTPVLIDENGFLSDTPIANLVAHFPQEGLVSPRHENILPGISLQVLEELAAQLGVRFHFRDLHPDELSAADELILTSTPFCLLPAHLVTNKPFSTTTRPVYEALMKAWSRLVNVDIIDQAKRFTSRS